MDGPEILEDSEDNEVYVKIGIKNNKPIMTWLIILVSIVAGFFITEGSRGVLPTTIFTVLGYIAFGIIIAFVIGLAIWCLVIVCLWFIVRFS